MTNIQESLNSILTTGGALKTLGEKKELRKAEEERRKLEEEYKQQQLDYQKKLVERQEREDKFNEEFYKKLEQYRGNKYFKKGLKSAHDLYSDMRKSFYSFEDEYTERKSDGGNNQW